MRVMIQLSADAAAKLQRNEHSNAPAINQLVQTITEFGGKLEPVHPHVDDPNLARYFTTEIEEMAAATQLVTRLQNSEIVESAYLQPPAALP